MNVDAELETWRRDWQTVAPAPADIAARVARQSRRMKLAIYGDLLVTVSMGGGAMVWAILSRLPEVALLASAVWIFLAAAWAIRVVTTRGNWSPSASDTRSYLELAVRRSTAALRMLRLVSLLFAGEMAFNLTWIYRVGGPRVFWNSPALNLSGAMTAAFLAFLVWHGRKKRAERDYFLALLRELDG
jgi:hypothetical protein